MALKPLSKQPLIIKSIFKLNRLKLPLINPVNPLFTLYKSHNYINYIVGFNKSLFYSCKYICMRIAYYKKYIYSSHKCKITSKPLSNNVTSLL